MCAVEDRGLETDAKLEACETERSLIQLTIFIRLGTPSGLRTMSTGVPSARERHVLHGYDLRDDTLITMTACHLITDRKLTLFRDIDLRHLHNTGLKFVTESDLRTLTTNVRIDIFTLIQYPS